MSNLAICYKNLADSATLTASPVAGSTTPVTYLQNDSRGDLFKATATGAQAILGEWGGTAYTVSCVHLERTNLVDGDTWRIQLYSDATWTTQVYDSGTVAPFATNLYDDWDYSNADLFFTPTASVKSFKITCTSAAIFQASRLVLGVYTTAEYNPKYGMSAGYSTNSTHERRVGGSLGANVQAQWRALTFDMFASTEAERAIWNEIGRYCGNTKTVWVSVFPSLNTSQERDHSMLGKFEQAPAVKWTDYNQYDFSLTLNEI